MLVDFLVWYVVTINIVAFFIFGYDKYAAIKKKWRVSEKNLLVLQLLGGLFGCLIGQSFFKHKTTKSSFLYKFYSIYFFWLVVLCLLLFRFGIDF